MPNFKKLLDKKSLKKTSQKGGVGFSPDVSACPIGGLPEIVPTSDCPNKVGPGSKNFAKALYTDMKGGAKKSMKVKKSKGKKGKKSQSKKRQQKKKSHKRTQRK